MLATLLLTATISDPAAATADRLRAFCGDCHADGASEGDFALEVLTSGGYGEKTEDRWVSAWKNLRAETMPPADADRPSASERAELLAAIERDVFGLDRANPDPASVPARRLNRGEYRRTVADLFAVDYDTTEEFPPDDASYGFDTVGDNLRMSPLLLEKYLKAAETIAAEAMPLDGPQLPIQSFWGGNFTGGGGTGDRVSMDEPSTLVAERWIETGGDYTLVVRHEVGDSWTKLPTTATVVVRHLSEAGPPVELGRFVAGWDSRNADPLECRVTLPKGKARFQLEVIPGTPHEPSKDPAAPDDTRYDLRIRRCDLVGPDGADRVYRDPANRILRDGPPPEDRAGKEAYVAKAIRDVADMAFRRPATDAEVDLLAAQAMKVIDAGDPFEAGVRAALARLLAMPQFLYRAESVPQPGAAGEVVQIDEFALASRLAYFLSGGPPDGHLHWQAREGKLRTNLAENVDRLLDDKWRRRRFVKDFVGQWLQTRDVHEHASDVNRILGHRRDETQPYYRRQYQIREAMRDETELLFDHLITESRPFTELLTAEYTFLNKDLAAFYGIEGVDSREMTKVSLPADSHRGGLLRHGSIQLITSNPTRTSPVKRGLFVLDNLLGTPAPPAPPNVPALEDAADHDGGRLSLRETLAKHREDPACAGCHDRMDPLGLAMENYNALGGWRDVERGRPAWRGREAEPDLPIDPSGTLITGESFANVAELQSVLATARRRDVLRCLTEKLLTYALGRGITHRDAPAVDAIVEAVEADGGNTRTLIHEVVKSVPFQMTRRGAS